MWWNKKYKQQIKELENRVHQLKKAGWYSINGWEWVINNKDKTFTDNPYNWYSARSIFSKDKPIDNRGDNLIVDDDYWKGKFE